MGRRLACTETRLVGWVGCGEVVGNAVVLRGVARRVFTGSIGHRETTTNKKAHPLEGVGFFIWGAWR